MTSPSPIHAPRGDVPSHPHAGSPSLPPFSRRIRAARVRVVANPWAMCGFYGKVEHHALRAPAGVSRPGAHHRACAPYFAEQKREILIAETDADGRRGPHGLKVPPAPAPPAAASLRRDPAPPSGGHRAHRAQGLQLRLLAPLYGLLGTGCSAPRQRPHPPKHSSPDKLNIPTTWKYRIVEGDTLSSLAQRYLGDLRRAAFLAEFNNIGLDRTLSIGDELTMPYHAIHTAEAREDLAALAATFYRDPSKAELLRRYNFRSSMKPLAKTSRSSCRWSM